MKINFTRDDVVVAASAYGHSIVRVTSVDDPEPTFYLIEKDANFEDEIAWRGTLTSCLTKMDELLQIPLAMQAIWMQPDDAVNDLIQRVDDVVKA